MVRSRVPGGSTAPRTLPSNYAARLIEVEAGISRIQAFIGPVTDIAQEVGLPSTIREKFLIQRLLIETGHGASIQTKGTGGKNQIRALKRRVSPDQVVDHRILALKYRFEIP